MFTEDEIKFGSKVAIIGQVIADKLFDGEPRIAETIRIRSVPFDVIGVLERKGANAGSTSGDDIVVIPLNVARSRLGSAVATREPLKSRGSRTAEEKRPARRQAIDYLVVKFDGGRKKQNNVSKIYCAIDID